jgi:DNA-binding beta-propeller fold protein YncE/subtilisin family serine protease
LSSKRGHRAAHVYWLLALTFVLVTCGTGIASAAQDDSDFSPAAAQLSDAPQVAGAYIVVLERSTENPGNVAAAQTNERGGDLGFVYRHALKGYSVENLSQADVTALRADPQVKYVIPDAVVEAAEGECEESKQECGSGGTGEANGEGEGGEGEEQSEQIVPPGVNRVFAPENGLLDIDGVDDVRIDADVAGLDSGYDITHPDLNVFFRTNCVPLDETSTFSGCIDNSGSPGNDHGTHASGTIGAIDNGFGVVGVAPGVRLWSVRVLGNNNAGLWSWTIGGLDWVLAHSSQIEVAHMNISGGKMPAVETEIPKLVEKGIVVVAAAGNNAVDATLKTPASNPDAITTAGLADYDGKPGGKSGTTCSNQGADDGPYWATNWGSPIDIAAPATCVLSTIRNGKYAGTFNGTSFAGPHVAGAAAVLASQSNPETKADVEAIREELIDEGSLDWRDISEDGHIEPVLDISGSPSTKTEAATGAVTRIDGSRATLTGALNGRGLATKYKFEYGPTTEYGQSFPSPEKELGAEARYTEVSEVLENLEPDQLYHYRLVAINSSGTVYGVDKTFITASWRLRRESEPTSIEQSWLSEISCPDPQTCIAVGHYKPTSSSQQTLTYLGAGTQWQLRTVPLPSEGKLHTLRDVSCISASFCMAVGFGEDKAGHPKPFAASWNGEAWTTQEVPGWFESEEHKFSELSGVSCVTTSECMAVGWYRNSGGTGRNYSVLWNGSSWTKLATPNQEPLEKSVLEDVSCPIAQYCVAVGWANKAASSKVILTWSGSSWKEGKAAAGTGRALMAIDCTSASHCVSASSDPGYVETWNGSSWTGKSLPIPSYANNVSMEGVDCVTPNYCVAVGQAAMKSNGVRVPLAEVWNGSTWSVQGAARNTSAAVGVLSGVACLSPRSCTAVGWSWASGARQPVIQNRIAPPDYQSSFGSTGSGNGQLKRPQGAAVDAEGNVWVADSENHRVQKFNSKGEYVTQFGTKGIGDGQLNTPSDIAITSGGDLWVVDKGNDRIQKFNSKGEYLAKFGSSGTGNEQFQDPWGIAISPSGSIWVSDDVAGRIKEFSATGTFIRTVGTSGVGNGQFQGPMGIAVDSGGNVWVVDFSNRRVQKFSSTGTYLSQFGTKGSGDGQFEGARAIDVMPSGNLVVTDRWLGRIQEFTSQGAFIAEFGLGKVDEPEGITVDAGGGIYIVNAHGNSIGKWVQPGRPSVTTAASQIGEGSATLNATVNPSGLGTTYQFEYGPTTSYGSTAPVAPSEIAAGTSGVKVSKGVTGLGGLTTYHYRIVATNEFGVTVGADSTFLTLPVLQSSFGSTGSGNGQLKRPQGAAVDAEGNVWVADSENHRVQKFNSKGEYVAQFGTKGIGNGQLDTPSDIAITSSGDLWVLDKGNDRVQKFNSKGEYLTKFGSSGTGNGQFQDPWGIAIAPSGSIWVSDNQTSRIQEFNSSGTFVRSVGSSGEGNGQFKGAMGIAVDSSNNVWVVDRANNRVQKFSSTGAYLSQFGTKGSGDGQFEGARAIDIMPSGNIVVTDRWLKRVQLFSSSGGYLLQFGGGLVGETEGIAVGSNGAIYVINASGNLVRKWL